MGCYVWYPYPFRLRSTLEYGRLSFWCHTCLLWPILHGWSLVVCILNTTYVNWNVQFEMSCPWRWIYLGRQGGNMHHRFHTSWFGCCRPEPTYAVWISCWPSARCSSSFPVLNLRCIVPIMSGMIVVCLCRFPRWRILFISHNCLREWCNLLN